MSTVKFTMAEALFIRASNTRIRTEWGPSVRFDRWKLVPKPASIIAPPSREMRTSVAPILSVIFQDTFTSAFPSTAPSSGEMMVTAGGEESGTAVRMRVLFPSPYLFSALM